MLCLYAVLVRYNLDVRAVIVLFSLFVCGTMLLIIKRQRHNERRVHLEAMLADTP
jgi:LPLT family lysophospholipid transporter-like MFS transporter